MAIPTGLSAQLGVGEETVYGTAVTVDRFYEFNSESLAMEIERMESQGLRAGQRVLRSDRWVAGSKTVSGDVELELSNVNLGLLLKHAMGGVATSQPGTLRYLHTFTPGDFPTGGLTVQVGRPDNGGTVRPFTYNGVVVATWEISANVGEIGMLSLGLVGQDETNATALETAAYPSGMELLTFVGATLTVAGTPIDVVSASIAGDNGLNADRRRLGSQTIKRPLENTWRAYTGSVEAYFDDLTAYTRFVDGTEASLVLDFEGSVIEATDPYKLTITANVRFDGETPTVGGPEELMQPLPFKVTDTGASSVSLAYHTTDATP